jgi:hypothetical protein
MRFFGLFLACMYASRTSGEPLLVFDFNDAPSILDSYLSYDVFQAIFSEIFRILEKDWQLSLRYSNFHRFLVSGSLRNASYGVNASQRFLQSPRRISN